MGLTAELELWAAYAECGSDVGTGRLALVSKSIPCSAGGNLITNLITSCHCTPSGTTQVRLVGWEDHSILLATEEQQGSIRIKPRIIPDLYQSGGM